MNYRITLLLLLMILPGTNFNVLGNTPLKTKKDLISVFEYGFDFHEDSVHRLNFKYADKKRGFRPYIAPALLLSTGIILHNADNTKRNFQHWSQKHFSYKGSLDDYMQYAPLAAIYSLKALGIKGKNNFGNTTALALKSFLLNDFIVYRLKSNINAERPYGNPHSFPSAHTSVAFTLAHIMHKEFSEESVWYSIGAYTCATGVAIMRVAKNAHWISDVLAGAGIGMLTTELVYLTHLYKWDNEHLKRFDILPFKMGNQKGLSLVYNF